MDSSPNSRHVAPGNGWSSLPEFVRRHMGNGILRNATWMLSGRGLEMAGRMAYFVIVAHVLGPAGFGTFVACTALMAALLPFATVGTGDVLVKHAAMDRNALPGYLGNAIFVTTVFGSLLSLLALLVRPKVLPPSATAEILTIVAITELMGAQSVLCQQAFQALDQGRQYAQQLGINTGMRVMAALVLLADSRPTAIEWAYLNAASSAVCLIIGLGRVCWCHAVPRLKVSLLVPCLREGIQFATAEASQTIYSDIDKTMLARLSTVEAAAIYAVASRFLMVLMLPVQALSEATYAEFFRRGVQGMASTFGFARRIIRRSLVYGVTTAAAILLAGGLLPLILGSAYADSASALRWLFLVPLIKSAHVFLSGTLTGAGYQWQRSLLDLATAAFSVLLNLWVIRAYAWRGAAWSTVITEALCVVLLYLTIRWYLRRGAARDPMGTSQPVFAARGE